MAGGNRSHLKKSQRNQNKIHGLAEVLETRRLLSHPAFFGSTIYPAGSFASAMVAADFNGDGKADLATANPTENSVSVLLNKGNGTFAAKTNYATSQSPSSVVAADLNGDGRIDLAVTNADSNTVSVLLNRGRGRFGLKTDYVTAARPVAVAATDLNGDGRVELIVANETDQNIQIFYNAGSGKFVKVGDYKVDGSPAFLAATDLNGDGRSDLAISVRSYDNGEKYFVRVLLNKGNGAFIPADYTSDTRPGAIFAADLDGSGKKDLVVETAYGELDVFINKGNGTFSLV